MSELLEHLEELEPELEHHERLIMLFVTPVVIILYLTFVLKVGSQWMKYRKPMKLKTITRIFNLIQVASNLYVCMVAAQFFVFSYRHCNLLCPSRALLSKEARTYYKNVGLFYLAIRVTDFMDTILFVLTKKQDHVSFLHVYHHVLVVFTATIIGISGLFESVLFVILINGFVHIIMYAYYFLSTFAVLKPYLWWKKYLTGIQLGQFVMIVLHSIAALYACKFPAILCAWYIGHASFLFLLFWRFYLISYRNNSRSSQKSE